MNNRKNITPSLSTDKLMRDHIIPTSTAGIIDRLMMHPIDNVITLKQKSPHIKTSVICRSIQSPKQLYAGLSWSLASTIPIRLSIFSSYSITRDELQANNILSMYPAMLAGGVLSGFLETAILCPADANRTRQILNIQVKNRFSPSTLYRGFTPLLARTTIENTVALAGSDMLLNNLPQSMTEHPGTAYLTGTISGILSQVIITPLDNLKTRVMSQNSGTNMWTHLRIMHQEGTLFKSAGLKILRTGIGTGLILGTISLVKTFTRNKNSENIPPENTFKK